MANWRGMASRRPQQTIGGLLKTALITGITGQDGAYLAAFLLDKGYEVHGIRRRTSQRKTARHDQLLGGRADRRNRGANTGVHLHFGDLTDATGLARIVQETSPDEIYNLAGQSHVGVSFDTAEYTANVNALGALRLLEAIRACGLTGKTRFYQASTSEMFGGGRDARDETSPFRPQSPYAAAKLHAHWSAVNHREAYGLFACSGILFNHESPLRDETFVSRKITRGLARVKFGLADCVRLGNLEARRDWGHAKDYVRAMWLMLAQPTPNDYVIASGRQHSVRGFVSLAAQLLGMRPEWEGEGATEACVDANTGKKVVLVDQRLLRPIDVPTLVGDPRKARAELGWTAQYGFEEMVAEMVTADERLAARESATGDASSWLPSSHP